MIIRGVPKTRSRTIDTTVTDLPLLARSWRDSLVAENKSARTIETYTESLAQLIAFAGDTVDTDDIRAFISHLLDTRSPSTANLRFRALQQFFNWCVREDEVDASPMDRMRRPHVPEKPVPVLADTDVKALLATCDGRTFRHLRDRAIILVLYDTGVRLSELLGMTVDDVNPEVKVINVCGKGSRWRSVPYGPTVARELDRYLRARRKRVDAESSALWLRERRGGALNKSGVATMLRRRGVAAGVGPVHPHQFRHTFAHEWQMAKGNETDLMQITGWRSRDMLSRYGASAAAARARESHAYLSPADRLLG